MSGQNVCKCAPRNVVVTKRHYNRSAFNGYRDTYSDYSEVRCMDCGQFWRTNAKWVETTPDGKPGDATRLV